MVGAIYYSLQPTDSFLCGLLLFPLLTIARSAGEPPFAASGPLSSHLYPVQCLLAEAAPHTPSVGSVALHLPVGFDIWRKIRRQEKSKVRVFIPSGFLPVRPLYIGRATTKGHTSCQIALSTQGPFLDSSKGSFHCHLKPGRGKPAAATTSEALPLVFRLLIPSLQLRKSFFLLISLNYPSWMCHACLVRAWSDHEAECISIC